MGMSDRSENEKAPLNTVELDYLGDDLPYLTRVLRACIRAENAEFYQDFGTEPGDIAIINLIGINPGISQNDLAAAVVLKKSAVTKIVKNLEARGIVERRKPDNDKRFNLLTLSEEGEEKRRQLREGMRRQREALLAPFPEEDRTAFLARLRQLCDHLMARNAARLGEESAAGGDS